MRMKESLPAQLEGSACWREEQAGRGIPCGRCTRRCRQVSRQYWRLTGKNDAMEGVIITPAGLGHTRTSSGSSNSRRSFHDELTRACLHRVTHRYWDYQHITQSSLALRMATRTLLVRSFRRSTFSYVGPSGSRAYATDAPPVTPPPMRENHGSSTNPRDSLRFADDASAESDPEALSSTTPLTPPKETPLPPTDFELVSSAEPIFPPLSGHASAPRAPTVPFSTHRFVRRLEQNGVKREMSVELMKATRALLQREEERVQGELLSRQDLENVSAETTAGARRFADQVSLLSQEAYLYTAALAELKTGSQVKSRNDGVALKSMTAVLQREADAIRQKLNEDMQRLHSDIQVRRSSSAQWKFGH